LIFPGFAALHKRVFFNGLQNTSQSLKTVFSPKVPFCGSNYFSQLMFIHKQALMSTGYRSVYGVFGKMKAQKWMTASSPLVYY